MRLLKYILPFVLTFFLWKGANAQYIDTISVTFTESSCGTVDQFNQCATGNGTIEIRWVFNPGAAGRTLQSVLLNGPTDSSFVANINFDADTHTFLYTGLCNGAVPYTIFFFMDSGIPGFQFNALGLMNGSDALTTSYNNADESCFSELDGVIDLSVSGGTDPYTLLWNTGDTDSLLTGLAAGEYIVDITDSTGCSFTDTTNIAGGDTILAGFDFLPAAGCVNETIVFTDTSVAPPGTFTLNWDFGTDAAPGTSGSLGPVNVSYSSPGTKNIELIIDNGSCDDTAFSTIDITALPLVGVNNDTTVCAGTPVQLLATGGAIFDWSDPTLTLSDSTINNPIATPATTTRYLVSVAGPSGCADTASVLVRVSNIPTITISPDSSICFGDTIGLSATGGGSYSWTANGATFIDDPSSDTPLISPSTSGTTTTYQVVVTNGASCTDSITVDITTNPLPIVGVSADTTMCLGETYQLTASGGTLFNWTPTDSLSNPGIANPIANPSTTTTYQVVVGDAVGCQDSANVTITINALPTVGTSNDTSICIGDSAQLLATGGTGFLWAPNFNITNTGIANPQVFPTSDTAYVVNVTNAAGCSDTGSVRVSVNPLPTIVTSGDVTICQGDTTTLTSGGGTIYSWSPVANLFTPNADITDANPNSSTRYTVNVTDANGCRDTSSVLVDVNSRPTAATNGDQTICEGDSVLLIATGGVNYSWSPLPNSTPNDDSTFADPIITTPYQVIVEDINACRDTAVLTVNVNPNPVVVISPNDTICIGDTSSLVAAGGAIFAWTGSNIISGAGTSTITANPIATDTYNVRVTDLLGCFTDDSTVIVVNNLPTIVISPEDTICQGDTSNLVAAGGTSFNWFGGPIIPPSNTGAIQGIPLVTDTFFVEVTDGAGCIDTASVRVLVQTIPGLVISNDTTICLGDTATLSVSGGTSQTWTGAPIIGLATNPTIQGNPIINTTYVVTVGDGTGCTETGSVRVSINSLPVATVSPNDTICEGDTASLNATGGIGYNWTGTDIISGSTNDTITANPAAGTHNYQVTVTDINGCENTANGDIVVNAIPVATTTPDDTICFGQSTMISAFGAANFLWDATVNIDNNTLQAPTVDPGQDTVYRVTVTDGNGCSDTASVRVLVNALPIITINPDVTICKGDTAQLTAAGGTSFDWTPGVNLDDSTSSTPRAIDTLSQRYVVTVTDGVGCSDTAGTNVIVDLVPGLTTSGDTTICDGDTIQIQAFGASIYTWNPTISLDNVNIDTPNAFPTATEEFIVRGELPSGCFTFDTLEVSVNAVTSIAIAGNTDICFGQSTTLTATAGLFNYQWSPTDSLSAPTSNITDANPSATSTYQVRAENAVGCPDSASITINVNSLPVIAAIGTPDTICNGDTTTLSATAGGGTYLWLGDSLFNPNDSITQANPTVDTRYKLEVTTAAGCLDSAFVTILIDPVITINVIDNDTVCAGDSIVLDAAVVNGSTFRWEPALVGNIEDPDSLSTPAAPTATTMYRLQVTNIIGCINTDSVNVIVEDYPTASIAGVDSICAGDTAQLVAGNGALYTWTSVPAGIISSPNNDTTDVIPVVSTTYQALVTSPIGCADSATHTIFVDPVPTVTVSPDTSICFGDTLSLRAAGGTFYSWTGANLITNNNDTVQANPIANTTYLVTASNFVGCMDTASIDVTVNTLPVITISPDDTVCSGDTTTLVAGGGTGFQWLGDSIITLSNQPNIDVKPSLTSVYTVIVSSGLGCIDSASVTVVANQLAGTITTIADTVCLGDTATLTSSVGASFNWTGNKIIGASNDSTIQVNPDSSEQYIVTIADSNGCLGFDTSFVLVNSLPAIGLPLSDSICANDTVQYIASGGTTYAWTGNNILNSGTSDTLIASPAVSGFHNVLVTDANDCQNTDSIFTLVNALPSTSISQSDTLCGGDTTTLRATGGQNYLWSGGPMVTVNNLDSVDVNPIVSTTYFVDISDSIGCSTLDSVLVVANGLPTASATESDSICIGDTATMTAVGGVSFVWSGSNIIPAANQASIQATPTISGEYYVTITDINGCQDIDTTQVVVHALPTIGLPASDSICSNDTISYNATGGDTYAWAGASIINSGNSDTLLATPSVSGFHAVTVIDSNGCINQDSIFTLVNTLPTASVSLGDTICGGDTASVSASGGTSYAWSGGPIIGSSNQDSIDVNPIVSTFYVVNVIDSIGCAAEDSVLVVANDLPGTTVTLGDTVCIGDTTTLTATGGVSYSWIGTNFITVTNIPTIEATPIATGEFYVVITDINGCQGVDTSLIVVNALPVIGLSAADTICANDTATYIATGGDTFTWSGPSILSGSNNDTVAVTPSLNATHQVTVVDSNGCINAASINTQVNALPIFSITPGDTICGGDTTSISAAGGNTYLWTGGPIVGTDTSASIQVNPIVTTNYFVAVSDSIGCAARDTVPVIANDLPGTTITAGDTICVGDTVTLTATGGITFDWIGPNIITATNIPTIQATPTSTDTFYVMLQDINGCFGFDTSYIRVNTLPPNAVTGEDTICVGDTATLRATGGTTFSWSGNDIISPTGVDTILTVPSASTQYFVDITDGNGCLSQDSITVMVNNLPSLATTPDDTICLFDTLQLVATGVGSFNWTGSGILDVLTNDSITVSPSADEVFVVSLVDSNACISSDSVEILVETPPVTALSGNDTICFGDTATLSVTGGVTQSWSGINIIGPSDSTILSANPAVTSQYIASALGLNGCATLDTMSIVVNSLPGTAVSVSSDTLCERDTVVMIAIGGSSYQWLGSNIISGDSGDTIVAIPSSGNSEYLAIVTDSNGCSDVDTGSVFIHAAPNLTVDGDTAICFGDTATLTSASSDNVTFSWSPVDSVFIPTDSVTQINPSQTTAYVATVIDSNLCTNHDTVDITVITLPNLIVSSDTSICSGDSVQLSASGGSTYFWSSPGGGNITNPDSAQTFATPDSSMTYTVVVGNPGGCSGSANVNITVDIPPAGSVFSDFDTACYGTNITITSILDSGYFEHPAGSYSYDNAVTFSNINTYSFTQQTPGDTTVCVIMRDQFGCNIPAPSCLTIHTLPALGYEIDTIQFPECTGPPGEFRVFNPIGGIAPYSFAFNGGDTVEISDTIYGNLMPGAYQLEMIDNFGCSIADILNFNSAIQFDTAVSPPVCNGQNNGEIHLSSLQGGVRPYQFSYSDTLINPFSDDSSFTGLGPGLHKIFVKDATGCVVQLLFDLVEPGLLDINLLAQTNILCAGDASGELFVEGTGGNSPYAITYDTTTLVGSGVMTFSDLPHGQDTLTIVDSLGCTDFLAFDILPADTLVAVISMSRTPSDCNGNDGEASVTTLSGGSGSYLLASSETNIFKNPTSFEAELEGKSNGLYIVYVLDQVYGCQDTITYTINTAGGILLDSIEQDAIRPTCTGNDGSITLSNVQGAPLPYSYQLRYFLPFPDSAISNFISTPFFEDLVEGSYYIAIQDGLGCEYKYSFIVDPPSEIFIDDVIFNDESCNESNGSIEIIASGGTPPLKYSITGETNLIDDINFYDNLSAGMYQIRVQDGINPSCIKGFDQALNGNNIDAIIDIDSTLCPTSNDGAVHVVDVRNEDTTQFIYQFAVSDTALFDSSLSFFNLSAGQDTLYIKQINISDSSFCIYPDPVVIPDLSTADITDSLEVTGFEVFSPDSMTAELFTLPSEKEQFTGVVWVDNVEGGTSPYQFSLNDTLGFVSFDDLDNVVGSFTGINYGEHTVYVMDFNGCIQEFTGATVKISFYIPNIFTPNGDDKNDTFIIHSIPEGTLLRVYDQWGNLVFYDRNYKNTWDGGKQSDGTYFYEIKNELGTFKGWVQLVRGN